MAAGDTTITIVGNLVADADLRFTPSGQAVANFRVASTPRYKDQQTGEWRDGEGLFLTCNVWRDQAEHCAETLQRGMRVIVVGRLKQRSYEKDGQKRTVFEVEVDEVGPSLKNATAKVTKTQRQGGGFGGDQGQPQGGFGQQGGQQPPQGAGNPPADDPWATNQSAGGGFSDEAPF
jgi:single-strand DNA-binding protein